MEKILDKKDKKHMQKVRYPFCHQTSECIFIGRTKGVTLLELVIVIAIIGILAAVAIISMGSASSATKMEAAQKELASEIKLAQSYALQGKIQNGATPCGYGVIFNSDSTYSIFYNKLEGTNVDCDAQNLVFSYNTHRASSVSLEEKTLSYNIKLSGSTSSSEIYFTVPSAKIYYSGGNPLTSGNSLSITLTGVTLNKKVTINESGLINIEQ